VCFCWDLLGTCHSRSSTEQEDIPKLYWYGIFEGCNESRLTSCSPFRAHFSLVIAFVEGFRAINHLATKRIRDSDDKHHLNWTSRWRHKTIISLSGETLPKN